MSNIKLIEGINVNLDLVRTINHCKSKKDNFWNIEFNSDTIGTSKKLFLFGSNYSHVGTNGRIKYKTEEEAQARIKQILEKQNSKKIEI